MFIQRTFHFWREMLTQRTSHLTYLFPILARTLANIMHPLYDAMNKRTSTWTQELQYAFDQSKTALANATLLHHPQDQVPTALSTDISDTAIGAVLEQLIRGVWQPVAFL